MSGIVGSSHNIRGSGIVAKLGTDGQVFTSSGAGVSQIFEDAAGGGLTEADQWRMNSNSSDNTADGVITQWENVDTDGFVTLGTGMSESSGIFTFPSTGFWLIMASFDVKSEGSDTCYIALQTTVNDSSYGDAARMRSNDGATKTETSGPGIFLFDVTDVANYKVRFNASSFATSSQIFGDSGNNISTATFIKLADT